MQNRRVFTIFYFLRFFPPKWRAIQQNSRFWRFLVNFALRSFSVKSNFNFAYPLRFRKFLFNFHFYNFSVKMKCNSAENWKTVAFLVNFALMSFFSVKSNCNFAYHLRFWEFLFNFNILRQIVVQFSKIFKTFVFSRIFNQFSFSRFLLIKSYKTCWITLYYHSISQ